MKDEKTLDAMIGSLIDRYLEFEEARAELDLAGTARYDEWERVRPELMEAMERGEIRSAVCAIRDGEVYRINFSGAAQPSVIKVRYTIIDLGAV